ncbi:hypothetical protein BTA51_28295 [Hahella sp. CCB-MM4]|nr:hypothetical protein BTA51_28295 [Hahella sp. CCB-MM4]
MALYIEMDKVNETNEFVEYSFGRGECVGLIRLDKANEAIHVINECPLDQSGRWSQRAAVKLIRLWREGRLPEKTHWAS